ATSAPCSASARAAAAPMPREPPVTNATLPVRFFDMATTPYSLLVLIGPPFQGDIPPNWRGLTRRLIFCLRNEVAFGVVNRRNRHRVNGVCRCDRRASARRRRAWQARHSPKGSTRFCDGHVAGAGGAPVA